MVAFPVPAPAPQPSRFVPELVRRLFAGSSLSSDAKLIAYRLARFDAPITWEGNDSLALALGWADSADGGRRRVQRALDELERAGYLRRYTPRRFWDWFRTEGQAAGHVPPRPARCPRRFLVFFGGPEAAPAVQPRRRTRPADGVAGTVQPATAEGIEAALADLHHDNPVMVEDPQLHPTMTGLSSSLTMTEPSCAVSAGFEPRITSTSDGTGFGSALGGEIEAMPIALRGAFQALFEKAPPVAPPLPERTPPPQGLPRPSSGRSPQSPAKPLTPADRALLGAAERIEALSAEASPAEVRGIAAELARGIEEPSPDYSVGFWAETIGLALAGVLQRSQLTDILRGLVGDGGQPYRAISKRWSNLRRTLGLPAYVPIR